MLFSGAARRQQRTTDREENGSPYYSTPRWALRQARQLLYPRRCPFCNRVLGSIAVCPDCRPELEQLRRKPGMYLDESKHYMENLSGAAAPFRYEGRVRQGILRAKYQAAPWAAVEMGVLLAEHAMGAAVRMRGAEPQPQRVSGYSLVYGCIVPVPASGSRRGYNVPELLALPLEQATGVPLERAALRCTRVKKRQAGLALGERFANVSGAFCADPELVEGRNILLVDDVITTGATVTACTQALLAAGAVSVFALAMATVEEETSFFEKFAGNA